MSANAVISGSLAEIKFVKTRSVCVLMVEIPIESAEDAISKFGIPLPGQEIPVALARLFADPAPSGKGLPSGEPVATIAAAGRDQGRSERARDVYRGLDAMAKAVTRASLLAKNPAFQTFMQAASEQEAVERLRFELGIKSRSEIGTNDRAFKDYLNVEHQFAVFQGREPEPR